MELGRKLDTYLHRTIVNSFCITTGLFQQTDHIVSCKRGLAGHVVSTCAIIGLSFQVAAILKF